MKRIKRTCNFARSCEVPFDGPYCVGCLLLHGLTVGHVDDLSDIFWGVGVGLGKSGDGGMLVYFKSHFSRHESK